MSTRKYRGGNYSSLARTTMKSRTRNTMEKELNTLQKRFTT